jgi:hypothetical protein
MASSLTYIGGPSRGAAGAIAVAGARAAHLTEFGAVSLRA